MKSLNTTLKTFLTVVGLLSFSLLLPNSNLVKSSSTFSQSAEEANCVVNLGFDHDGVLPSAQGFTYLTGGHSGTVGATESAAFSVSGGFLRMDTAALGPNMGYAYYERTGLFDPTQDLVIETRLRLYADSTRNFGIYATAPDLTFAGALLENGLIHALPSATFPAPDAADFHTYQIRYYGSSREYEILVDDNPVIGRQSYVYTGAVPIFSFGDLTGHPGFNGRADIDFVRYYQASPVCVTPPSGLVSWWPGDGNANDIAGGNHGTLHNGATFTAGLVDQAFSFDGMDDYVEIPDSPNLTPPSNSITLDAWIKPDVVGGLHVIVTKYSVNLDISWVLMEFDGRLRFGVYQAGGIDLGRVIDTTSPVLTAGEWQHIAGTFDIATQDIKIYVNGAEVPAVLSTEQNQGTITSIRDSSSPVRIGALQDGNSNITYLWSGLIDEVEISDRALTASEVQAIYNAGSAGKCKEADGDGDGVNDTEDNCPTTPNPDQTDFDLDGKGDACDAETGPPQFKDQCKNGGWSRYNVPRTFKNQGDCIQFVNTGK